VDCSEVLEQLGDYLDRDAREELCRDIEAHLQQCRDCRLEVDTLRKMIVLFQKDTGHRIEVPMRAARKLDEALAREYGNRGPARAD